MEHDSEQELGIRIATAVRNLYGNTISLTEKDKALVQRFIEDTRTYGETSAPEHKTLWLDLSTMVTQMLQKHTKACLPPVEGDRKGTS